MGKYKSIADKAKRMVADGLSKVIQNRIGVLGNEQMIKLDGYVWIFGDYVVSGLVSNQNASFDYLCDQEDLGDCLEFSTDVMAEVADMIDTKKYTIVTM